MVIRKPKGKKYLTDEEWDRMEKYVRDNSHMPLRSNHVAKQIGVDRNVIRGTIWTKLGKRFEDWIQAIRVEKALPMAMSTDPETGNRYTTAHIMNVVGIRGRLGKREFIKKLQDEVEKKWISPRNSLYARKNLVVAVVRAELRHLMGMCGCDHCIRMTAAIGQRELDEEVLEKARTRISSRKSRPNTYYRKPENS